MKKIIALAVASAFVVPAAMAEVTVYGSVRTGIEISKIDEDKAADTNRVRLADESSRIGFKGSDKLDNGLTAIWGAESRIRAGSANPNGTTGITDSQGWNARDTYIGLKGNFGTVKAGTRMSDIIDMATGDFMNGGGDMNDTITGFNNIVRRGANRPTNMVVYESPLFNGFGFKADYDFGNSQTNNGAAQGAAASVFYKSKLFDAGIAYKHNNNSTGSAVNGSAYGAPSFTTDATYDNYIVGANIKPMAGLQIAGAWQRVDVDNGKTSDYQDSWALGATYQVGKLTYKLAAGQILESDKGVDNGAWQVNGGVAYALSKQTQVQFGLNYIDNDDKATGLIGTDTGLKNAAAGGKTMAGVFALRTDF